MKILILGATGTIGNLVRLTQLEQTENTLVELVRNPTKLGKVNGDREQVVTGDILDLDSLNKAMSGVDFVFCALSGNLPVLVNSVITSMDYNHVSRIIFISSMGIYNEIPNNIGSSGNLKSNPFLEKYAEATRKIEESGLVYTIIRPGWFDKGEKNYTISQKGDKFEGHDVSIYAIDDLVQRILAGEIDGYRKSIGVHRPMNGVENV